MLQAIFLFQIFTFPREETLWQKLIKVDIATATFIAISQMLDVGQLFSVWLCFVFSTYKVRRANWQTEGTSCLYIASIIMATTGP